MRASSSIAIARPKQLARNLSLRNRIQVPPALPCPTMPHSAAPYVSCVSRCDAVAVAEAEAVPHINV